MKLLSRQKICSDIPSSKLQRLHELYDALADKDVENIRLTSVLRCVLDLLPVGVIMCSEKGNVVLWNCSAENLLGPPCKYPIRAWKDIWIVKEIIDGVEKELTFDKWPIVRALNGEKTDKVKIAISRTDVSGITNVMVEECASPVVCPIENKSMGGMIAFQES